MNSIDSCAQCFWQMYCCQAKRITLDTIRKSGIYWACYSSRKRRISFTEADRAGLDVDEVWRWRKTNKLEEVVNEKTQVTRCI